MCVYVHISTGIYGTMLVSACENVPIGILTVRHFPHYPGQSEGWIVCRSFMCRASETLTQWYTCAPACVSEYVYMYAWFGCRP